MGEETPRATAGGPRIEGNDWRPIRYLTVDHIGAIIEIRRPTPDGHLRLTPQFVIHTMDVPAAWTYSGHPRFETIRLNDRQGDFPFTAYDGDEYREIKP